METTTIYRVEHSTLRRAGPFNSERHLGFLSLDGEMRRKIAWARTALREDYEMDNGYMARHPGPWEDMRGDFSERHQFAVTSLDMLKSWFAQSDAVIDALADAGFTVRRYIVPSDGIIESKSGMQVAVVLDHAIDSDDLTILALLD